MRIIRIKEEREMIDTVGTAPSIVDVVETLETFSVVSSVVEMVNIVSSVVEMVGMVSSICNSLQPASCTYLSYPRNKNFAGQHQADASTRNNDRCDYRLDKPCTSYK